MALPQVRWAAWAAARGGGVGVGEGLCPQPHQQQPAVPEAAPGTEAAELE